MRSLNKAICTSGEPVLCVNPELLDQCNFGFAQLDPS